MPTLPIAKLVFWVCCALVLSGAIPDSSAADLLNTQSRKAHVLRVAGAQLPVRNDVQKNLEAITRAIEFAAREKADVLVTPEGSLYDREGDYLGFHAKILLCRWMADPKRKGEVDYFKSSPLRTFQLEGLTVAGLVCNDLWANPEWTPMPDPHLARQLADQGARVLFFSVNSGQDEGETLALHRAFRKSNLRLRARSAKLWVIVANASDPKGQREANCHSGVLAPDGHWVVQADPKGEQFFAQTLVVE